MAAFIGLVTIAGLLAFSGLLTIPFGNSSSGTAAAYANLTEVSDPTLNIYNETRNWTIYEYNSQFVVTGKIDGEIVYLEPNGNVTQVPYFYDLRPNVRNSVLAWSSKHDQNQTRYPEPEAPSGSELESRWSTNWSVFEHNGSYVVGGKINGSVVYLYPNATYGDDPFFYENKSHAEGAIIIWESYDDQFPGSLPSVDPIPVEEVQSDLEDWDPDGSDSEPDEYHWDGIEHPDLDETDDRTESNDVTNRTGSTQNELHLLRGTVYDSNDTALSGATVHLSSSSRTITTNSSGAYEFRNISAGKHRIYVEPPNDRKLAVSDDVRFRMFENGSVAILGNPNAIYFETQDGTITDNELELVVPSKQPIRVEGQGTDIRSTIQFEQPRNADNLTVRLRGVNTLSRQITTIRGTENSTRFSIDGTQRPTNQRVRLWGVPTSENVSQSGTYRGNSPNLGVRGNLQPRNLEIDLASTLSRTEVTDNGKFKTSTIPTELNLYNLPRTHGWENEHDEGKITVPRSGTYKIAADWKMYNPYYSRSFSGSVALEVCKKNGGCSTVESINKNNIGGYKQRWGNRRGGTLEATVTVEKGDELVFSADGFGNNYVEFTDSRVGTYQGSTSSKKSVTIDGNLSPTDVEMTLTGRNSVETAYKTPGPGSSGDVWEGGYQTTEKTLFKAPEDGYYHLNIPWFIRAYTMGTWGDDIGGYASIDISIAGETVVSKDVYTMAGEEESREGTITKRVYLEQGESIDVETKARDAGYANVYSSDEGVVTKADTGRVTVSVNGETKRTSSLSAGETESISLPLESGQNTISVSTSGGSAVKYSLSRTERTGTRSPIVKLGGNKICSFNGVLKETKTCDIPAHEVSKAGIESLELKTESGPVNYTFTYEARAVPEEATVQINGQAYTYPDEFETSQENTGLSAPSGLNISELSLGANELEILTEPVDGVTTKAAASVSYDGERSQTYEPKIVVRNANDERYSKRIPMSKLVDGQLYGNVTTELPAEWFTEGENIIRVKTADSSQVYAFVEGSGLTYQYSTFEQVARTNTTSS
ncbi:carboxypeptidase-like regulatory domain-containing protein [Halorussus salinus]|uniref:carboxypeptidase-like regulatory domain-containing protein n=1 Tax=Halorussus salinus TaxID=1364935 RepID=UPI00138F9769|nr:carboxypeptidase-like regulatory domain-containing protein [Halorussus salinus]